ncbi:hypothetical protein CesoFtcFv8_009537 [Champsocephalus esox]|uniref:Uncharacterized protein n=1 Tax=Champsocephalus esox TaxID=159716 RepID=A0AAN8CEM8_9TELE|nr:hypothetical protein CesoFtcFv8_009537 [Champsocephalus esox]
MSQPAVGDPDLELLNLKYLLFAFPHPVSFNICGWAEVSCGGLIAGAVSAAEKCQEGDRDYTRRGRSPPGGMQHII